MYKVLIADDEPIILNGIQNMIDWDDRIVLSGTAENGLEALQHVERSEPDIIISDLRMPGMSGLELIEKVKETRRAEFIILTGYCEFDYAVKAMQYGVKHFLSKPCNRQVLNDALNDIIEELSERETNEKNLNVAINHAKNNILLQLVTNKSYGRKDWLRDTALLNIHLPYHDPIRLVLLRVEGTSEYEHIDAASEIVRRLCGEELVCLHTIIKGQALLLIQERSLPALMTVAERAVQMFKREYDRELWIEVSDVGTPASARSLYRYMLNQWPNVPKSGGDPLEIRSVISETVRKMLQYIHQNYHDETLSLKAIASSVLYRNVDHLGKLFKKEVGIHFSVYVSDLRVKKASELLLSTDRSVGEIAEQCGFGLNTRYFSQVFKKSTGFSPREYRKQKRDL